MSIMFVPGRSEKADRYERTPPLNFQPLAPYFCTNPLQHDSHLPVAISDNS